jgi:hypothetical protein
MGKTKTILYFMIQKLFPVLSISLFFQLIVSSCLVHEQCYHEDDCKNGNCIAGQCIAYECIDDEDCNGGACVSHCCVPWECRKKEDCDTGVCMAHKCTPDTALRFHCPEDMIPVDNQFCMDRYEGGRADAVPFALTDSLLSGNADSLGPSRKGIVPWKGVDFHSARALCERNGKRLCSEREWTLACRGPDSAKTMYCYGDYYETGRCNGIYAFCDSIYPGCYYDFGFHVMPTGSFPACTTWCGIFDISGNLWEWVSTGSGTGALRGGAYNCSSPGEPHFMLSCEFNGGTKRPASGIRCCHDGVFQ